MKRGRLEPPGQAQTKEIGIVFGVGLSDGQSYTVQYKGNMRSYDNHIIYLSSTRQNK